MVLIKYKKMNINKIMNTLWEERDWLVVLTEIMLVNTKYYWIDYIPEKKEYQKNDGYPAQSQ